MARTRSSVKKHPNGGPLKKQAIVDKKKKKAPIKRTRVKRSQKSKSLRLLEEDRKFSRDSPRLTPSLWPNDLTQANPLLSLPVEIKQQIWKLLLFNESEDSMIFFKGKKQPGGVKWKFKRGISQRPTVAGVNNPRPKPDFLVQFYTLSLTCRQIYLEVVEDALLYKFYRLDFFFQHTLIRFLSTIPEKSRNTIRYIKLTLPFWGRDYHNNILSPKALGALRTCTGLQKLSLVIPISNDRYYSTDDHTERGNEVIRTIEVLIKCLKNRGLMGLKKFDVLLWDAQLWREDHNTRSYGNRPRPLLKMPNGVMFTPFSLALIRPIGPSVYPDYWSDVIRRKLELLVEELRLQVTQPRGTVAG